MEFEDFNRILAGRKIVAYKFAAERGIPVLGPDGPGPKLSLHQILDLRKLPEWKDPPADLPFPEDRTCEEASPLSRAMYIPCGNPATSIVFNGDPQPYFMCHDCAQHNVLNRGARVLAAKDVTVFITSGQLPPAACPVCKTVLDGLTSVTGNQRPDPRGQVTVCAECDSFLVFNDDLSFRLATEEEKAGISEWSMRMIDQMREERVKRRQKH